MNIHDAMVNLYVCLELGTPNHNQRVHVHINGTILTLQYVDVTLCYTP